MSRKTCTICSKPYNEPKHHPDRGLCPACTRRGGKPPKKKSSFKSEKEFQEWLEKDFQIFKEQLKEQKEPLIKCPEENCVVYFHGKVRAHFHVFGREENEPKPIKGGKGR
jgi:hypothetical protein